jgi:hypothetical protein
LALSQPAPVFFGLIGPKAAMLMFRGVRHGYFLAELKHYKSIVALHLDNEATD